MKILIINSLYTPNRIGGAEKSVQQLAEALVIKGHKVSVICLDKENSKKVINGVEVYYLKIKNIYWPFEHKKYSILAKTIWHIIDTYNFFYGKRIRRILKNVDPDIVHIHNLGGFSTQLAKQIKSWKKELKIIHTFRDYYLLCPKATMYKNDANCNQQCFGCKQFSKQRIKSINDVTDAVTGVSEYILKKHLDCGINKNKIHSVIYNAVEQCNVRPTEKKDLKEGPKTFGFIGSINPSKGIEMLLKLFLNTSLEKREWKLLIAGKGDPDYVNMIKNKYKDYRITLIGYTEAEDFYRQIDALIVPSLWNEPFGRVVIEAAQKGLPVFVNNKGGLMELERKLDAVKYLNEKNIEQFITKKGKTRIVPLINEFNVKSMVQKYIDLYTELLRR